MELHFFLVIPFFFLFRCFLFAQLTIILLVGGFIFGANFDACINRRAHGTEFGQKICIRNTIAGREAASHGKTVEG